MSPEDILSFAKTVLSADPSPMANIKPFDPKVAGRFCYQSGSRDLSLGLTAVQYG